MTYEEARAFADKTKAYGSVLGLDSIRALMAELGNVQEELSVIHIAGTNGKGSVGAMLDAVLQSAGCRVGRYSSPAVFAYEEIWQINGQNISREDYGAVMSRVAAACQALVEQGRPHPTSFEVETALAFLYFREQQCDVVLLETGMGGSMDATNLISHPLCSVITSISRDHMAFLGNTLTEIAEAKAGIIKEGCPVVSAWQQPEAEAVLRRTAQERHAPMTVAEKVSEVSYDMDRLQLAYGDIGTVTVNLTGAYQAANTACALETVRRLQALGYGISPKQIRTGLAQVRWSGRMERLCSHPYFFLDGAHNEAAAYRLAETVENCFTNRRITYIIGVLADKEYEKMLSILLPYCRKVYTVTPGNPRALAAEELARSAREILCGEISREGQERNVCRDQTGAGRFFDAESVPEVVCAPDISRAVEAALQEAEPEDVILALGSLSYLAEVKACVSNATSR